MKVFSILGGGGQTADDVNFLNEDKIFKKVKCLINVRIQASWICSDSSVDVDLGQESGDPQNRHPGIQNSSDRPVFLASRIAQTDQSVWCPE